MRLTGLTLRNFKAVGDEPVSIPLKPLTLLFGPNSVGKSSVIQALHYALEVFERRNLDADHTLLGGRLIDLGGFANLVHGRDLTLPVVMTFEFELGDRLMYPESDRLWALDPGFDFFIDDVARLADLTKTIGVTVAVEWSQPLRRPDVTRYETSINGIPVARIVRDSGTRKVLLAFLNWNHPIFAEQDHIPEAANWGFRENIRERGNSPMLELGQVSALPDFDRFVSINERAEDLWRDYEPEEWTTDETAITTPRDWAMTALTYLVCAPGRMLRDYLQEFKYLGPIREVPPRRFETSRTPDFTRWAGGLAAWDTLATADEELLVRVNEWLEKRLDSGYRIELLRYRELQEDSPIFDLAAETKVDNQLNATIADLRRAPVLARILLRSGSLSFEPQDVGAGIAQVIPAVVLGLSAHSGLVCIEQPELHIHPAMQVALADLFLEQANREPNLGFLLETHSEHLVLRMQRRIRETAEGSLPEGSPELKPEDVSIVYLDRSPNGALCAFPIRLDEDGDFIDRWPRGFFPERFREHYGE